MSTCKADSNKAERVLIEIEAVAEMLAISVRTVRRLADAGRMPLPLRIPGLRVLRWRRVDIERFIANGCVALHKGTATPGK